MAQAQLQLQTGLITKYAVASDARCPAKQTAKPDERLETQFSRGARPLFLHPRQAYFYRKIPLEAHMVLKTSFS
ncbi:hypothetical protein CORC01_01130 [Colletotrichum orchidophilum]|uniref:Uncharacterized protein n=1 Tax=Colletotrichum orchidophilum TaxID=1209926 RepID=A0A1G4BPL8_9PEZI|nr:uncharacterized protein CORC01_01130 [Colletotrichum orchidophilum]OHF03411.1 hypothetical protein CORC01_01130 [Colletotrichum orchidophilum]